MFKLDQPLGLPQGSVRAIITIILTITFTVLAFKGIIEAKDVVGALMMAFGFYFGSRNNNSKA